MSAKVVSFAEESCWDGDKFRSVRREVVFVIAGHSLKKGELVRQEFRADYGLFYDVEDELLINLLEREIPDVKWGWYVYHKKLDHSGISIIHPESGKTVGSIYPRGRSNPKLSGEILAANVIPISLGGEYRARRLAREEVRAERRRRRDSGED